MKIAVNARFLIESGLEGVGWYTYEILKRMALDHPEDEFILYFDRPYSESFLFSSNVKGVKLSPPARHPVLFTYWNQYLVGKQLKKDNADVYWTTDGFFPLKTKVPVLAVIHDIAHQVLRNNVKKAHQIYYDHFIKRTVDRANAIMTVSEFSKSEMVKILNADAEKIHVGYNAPREVFKPLDNEEKMTGMCILDIRVSLSAFCRFYPSAKKCRPANPSI